MLSKKIRLVASVALASALFIATPATTFAQLSKTPNLSNQVQPSEPATAITMPEGYPTELNELTPDIRSYVVIDQKTNRILMEREGNTVYPIASMSKIMPVYLVYKAIEEGKLTLDQKITVHEDIVQYISSDPELSNVGLETGVEYSVQDLLYAVMMVSGNDATSALMWHLYGSEQAAVQAISDQLIEWGITDFEFYSTSGAPNVYLPKSMWMPGSTETDENKMSAADVALAAQYIVEKYPQILDITTTRTYIFMAGTPQEITLNSSNLLLEGNLYGRPGVTGLKSGYTDLAGKNFVTTTTENGTPLIAVVMGIQEPYNSYQETGILLDGLAQHPEVFNLEGFTSNRHKTLAEKQAEEAARLAEEQAKQQAASQTTSSHENRRDSFFTNLMRNIFGIFN